MSNISQEKIIDALQCMFDEYSWEGGDLSILEEDEPDHPLVKAMNVLHKIKNQ